MPRIHLVIAAIAVVLLLATAGAGYYFYDKYQKAQKELQLAKTDPSTLQNAAKEEVKRLVEEVGKLISLPEGEDPTVATITDLEKLKDQPFFQKAKNGDKIIIYTNAKKAILYDPVSHKILDVAPVNIGTSSAQQTKARIVLRNGTTTAGLTNIVEADLKKSFADANVVAKDNAAKNDYQKTIVIALNDGAKDAIAGITKALNVTTEPLPQGENKPDADILILIGQDRAPAPSQSPSP